MFIKLLFIIFIFLVLKVLIIKFDYHDFYTVVISILLVIFSYFYVVHYSKFYIVLVIIVSLSLIFYSFFKHDSSDKSIIIYRGVINFKNLYNSKYNLDSLINELKKNNIFFLDEDVCAILKNGNLEFYYTNTHYYSFPLSIILDGRINKRSLLILKKGKRWLDKFLKSYNCDINDIKILLFYKDTFYIIKK